MRQASEDRGGVATVGDPRNFGERRAFPPELPFNRPVTRRADWGSREAYEPITVRGMDGKPFDVHPWPLNSGVVTVNEAAAGVRGPQVVCPRDVVDDDGFVVVVRGTVVPWSRAAELGLVPQ